MKNRFGIIYRITNKLSGKAYVGQTVYNAEIRFREHCNKKTESAIHHAINFYGKKNFTVEEIYSCLDQTSLNEAEIHFITFFRTISPYGYNIDIGGGAIPKTKESIEKANVKKRGMKILSRRRGIIATCVKTGKTIECEVVKDFLNQGFTNLSNIRLVLCGKRKKTKGHYFQYKANHANQNLIVEIKTATAVQRIEVEPVSKTEYASKRRQYLERKNEIIQVYVDTNSSYKASDILGINRRTLMKLLKMWGVLNDNKTACKNRSNRYFLNKKIC